MLTPLAMRLDRVVQWPTSAPPPTWTARLPPGASARQGVLECAHGATVRYVVAEPRQAAAADLVTVVLSSDPPCTLDHVGLGLAGDLLAAGYRVVAFEAPGNGFSRLGTTFTLRDCALIVVDVIERVARTPRVVLALTCLLGLAGMLASRERPDLIRGVVVAQAPRPSDAMAWMRRVDASGALLVPVIGQALMAIKKRDVARAWVRAALPRDAVLAASPLVHELTSACDAAFDSGACFCLASLFQGIARGLDAGDADALTVDQPAVVLWGAADRTHRGTDKRAVTSLFRDLREYVALQAVGHFVDLEPAGRAEMVRAVGVVVSAWGDASPTAPTGGKL